MKETSICICGDLYLSTSIPNVNYISEEVLEIFQNSDFNIINLESPITKEIKEHKIIKTGPHLNGNPNTFSFLKQLNTHLVTLANNHIMDYGTVGLRDTLMVCQDSSINFVGAGMTLDEAKKPFIFEKNHLRIAVLNFAENEWASAEKEKAGANPLNVIDNVRQIKNAKDQSDIIIVIIHGGHEYYNLPSPRMVNQYRFYAENGASLIVGHHPHCIGGYEVHNGIPVFYSLGNFLFTMKSEYKEWYKGLVLKLNISKNSQIVWELIPIIQSKSDQQLTLLTGQKKEQVLKEVKDYSTIISNESLLSIAWNKFLFEKEKQYLNIYSPLNFFDNKYLKSILSKLKLNMMFMKKQHYKQILNNIRCEAHLEASKEIIEKYLKKNENSYSSPVR
jgi:poly-gamma-glutamate capsule biosynthesis protein CapA/YwtB (metallophosphatase superfamily)